MMKGGQIYNTEVVELDRTSIGDYLTYPFPASLAQVSSALPLPLLGVRTSSVPLLLEI